MATVERTIAARPEEIFAVLADGWSYSDWVVGTTHIRGVDPGWPAPGTEIHFQAGPWPLSLLDRTTSLESRPPTSLLLAPRLRALGEAKVRFTLTEVASGRTRVRMSEEFDKGPLRWLRNKVNDLVLHWRMSESLRRLGDLAIGKARSR